MKQHRVSKRRRKENKTDYKKRFNLLKSGMPRIVFRKTNTQVLAQYVISNEAQDKVEFGISSKDLVSYGWPEKSKGSLKSTTASYLVGYYAGKKILNGEMKKPIVDFGMENMIYKSRVFGFLKGLVDAGVEVGHREDSFPDESRIKGEHMKNQVPFEEIKSKLENAK